MNLTQLENIIPGEAISRKDMLEKMRLVIKEKYDIDTEPVSYHDIECMWLRAKMGSQHHNICDVQIFDFEYNPEHAKEIRNLQKVLNNGS